MIFLFIVHSYNFIWCFCFQNWARNEIFSGRFNYLSKLRNMNSNNKWHLHNSRLYHGEGEFYDPFTNGGVRMRYTSIDKITSHVLSLILNFFLDRTQAWLILFLEKALLRKIELLIFFLSIFFAVTRLNALVSRPVHYTFI